jgi:hypothetical protein
MRLDMRLAEWAALRWISIDWFLRCCSLYFMAKFRIRTGMVAGSTIGILLLTIVSCSETKVSRCNRVITVANQATQDIQSLPGQTLQPKERFAKAAEILDRAARDVGGLKINDTTVQKLQMQLVGIYNDDRTNNQVLATSTNAKEIRQALQKIQQNDLIQKNLVKAVNTYCQAPEPS